ncbi:MAG TPA: PIN domain-containing protein [Acidimicrobiales bacterium]|nr:PIN domain-containing protein [Acidimicrobiales bacterium]
MAIPALLDACVLYPVGLRDTLLNVAEAGFFRPLWSEEILAETSRNIVEDIPDLTAEHLEKTFDAMRRAFPEARVRGYEHLIESMPNHPKDRHVLAAAVAGSADVLVTSNLRHFPPEACEPLGIRVQSPDDFLVEMIELGPGLMVDVLRRQAARKARPPLTLAAMLERLVVHAPAFVATLQMIQR